ncbi:MAG: hypothetical protein Q7U14_11625, partial [Lacisediminimonas sp.]|nr:hypothetical protein [Lacisediminimonas sp.]
PCASTNSATRAHHDSDYSGKLMDVNSTSGFLAKKDQSASTHSQQTAGLSVTLREVANPHITKATS